MLEKNLEKKWLIKSENRVLGPFHYDQIEDLLKKRQISLIDEIRDMETRWLYIRENPNFKGIVDEIRKEMDSKNDSTKTYQTASKTNGELVYKTNAQVPMFTEVDVQEASIVQESVSSDEIRSEPMVENQFKKMQTKIYGLPQDQYFQKQVNYSKRGQLRNLALFVLGILACAGAYTIYQKRAQAAQEEQLVNQIKKYEFLELNQKVANLYSRAPESVQRRVLPEILSVFPLLESQHLVQQKEIDSLQGKDLSLEQKTNIQLINFLAAMQNQNLTFANEALIKARSLQPTSNLVLENKAIFELKKNSFKTSYDTFWSLHANEKSGRYLLGCLQAFIGLSSIEKLDKIGNLTRAIEAYTSSQYDYKKELLLGQMALARWTKNDLLFKVSWNQFLNTPILLASYFLKPLLLPTQVYLWKDLEEYKIAVRSALTPEELIVFEIHNYLEGSQVSAANQYAENSLPKIKDKAVRQQMTLLTLNSQTRRSEIIALEKTNQLDPSSELNHLLLALNKLEVDPKSDISVHIKYFGDHQLIFYQDWLTLAQLVKTTQIEKIKPFLRDRLVTVKNFIPMTEARSMIE